MTALFRALAIVGAPVRALPCAFGGPSAPPAPPPPTPIPDPNGPAALAAQSKAMTDALARSGRLSTILTAGQDNGGSSAYSGAKLGAS